MRFFFYTNIFLSILTFESQAQQLGFYFDGAIHSPAIKFNPNSHHWKSTRNGNYAYADMKVGGYFSLVNGFSLGFEKRLTHYWEFTPDTSEFYGQLENKNIPAGAYPLSLNINGIKTNSLFAGFDLSPTESLQLTVKGYFLEGVVSQQASLTGSGTVGIANTYSYIYELDYLYGENQLFEAQSEGVAGYGHSLDIDIKYGFNSQTLLSLGLKDVLYRLYWSRINQDKGCVARPPPVDTPCLLDTVARTGSQSLPLSINGRIVHRLDNAHLELEWVKKGRYRSVWLGLKSYGLGTYVDALNETLKLSYESERLAVKWAFDDYKSNRANHWQFTLAANWPIP